MKRNYTKELMLPFKYGAVSMAQKAAAPIIPYSITGSYRLFSKDLKIEFGEPFYVGEQSLPEANAVLYERILALLKKNMPPAELAEKRVTTFTEWSKAHEKTS